MVINPDLQLENAIRAAAEKWAASPERFALVVLRAHFLPSSLPFEPRDDWERALLSIGVDCGVSPPDSAFTSEELYD